MKCFACLTELGIDPHSGDYDITITSEQKMWLDGSCDLIYPGYGSNYDGHKLRIAVCDKCLEKGLENKTIEQAGFYL